jgi:predicted RNA-binding protein Jag
MSGNGIISKGKNVKEAIEVGLQLLDATIQEVDIEIIEPESKGFLGIGSKPAIVRLIKKRPVNGIHRENLSTKKDELEFSVEETKLDFPDAEKLPAETTPSSTSTERIGYTKDRGPEADKEFGSVWVKDGRIYCKETPSHYPMITPAKGVSLYKNGELVRKTTVISEKDTIKVELNHEIKHTEWSIELDEKKMTATLHIQPGYKKTCTLIDQEPNHHIQLEVKETVEVWNHLNPNHVVQKMQELNIKTGIQKIEILKATETTEPGTFEIAKGIAPQKGKDGWLEILVDTETRLNGPNKSGDGSVDYRVIKSIANVNAGQVIAVIHPPQPGKPGVTVTGETVPPDPAQELVVELGRGVDFIEKGSKIVALGSGRPKFEIRGMIAKISIIPKLLHTEDVNVHSGNIRYTGDVEIQGNVDERMLVDAIEDVLVHGNVNRANIQAGNRIFINKNVINSHLTAGKRNPFIYELGQLLKKIHSQLESLSAAINQIYSAPGFKTSDIAKMGLSSLIRILLEKKFNTLPLVIKEYTQMIMKADMEQILNDEYKELGNELINGFLKLLPAHLKGPEDLRELIKQVKKLYEFSNTPLEPNASITIPYAFNSEIFCSGDIYIVGQGIINTKIHSGGKVVVEGLLRGGEIYAEFGAEIGEAGTRGGIPTCIRVPDGQTIKIKYALEGTIIQIGKKSHQFLHFEKDVFARIDKHGYLQLH